MRQVVILFWLLLSTLAWANDSGVSTGSGIDPGQPWVDDSSTLTPGSDRDVDIRDNTPHLTFRDTTDDTAYQFMSIAPPPPRRA